ncbi:MAG: hypothetical protein R3E55_07060 [Burkholderiaceae bacterium]|nr:hypothetical protein [Burkholderiaceae bacterium]
MKAGLRIALARRAALFCKPVQLAKNVMIFASSAYQASANSYKKDSF